MRCLADLPNTAGFEFVGIDHDGNKLECVVKLNPVGCYGAYSKSGDPCFMSLSGWEPLEQHNAHNKRRTNPLWTSGSTSEKDKTS